MELLTKLFYKKISKEVLQAQKKGQHPVIQIHMEK